MKFFLVPSFTKFSEKSILEAASRNPKFANSSESIQQTTIANEAKLKWDEIELQATWKAGIVTAASLLFFCGLGSSFFDKEGMPTSQCLWAIPAFLCWTDVILTGLRHSGYDKRMNIQEVQSEN